MSHERVGGRCSESLDELRRGPSKSSARDHDYHFGHSARWGPGLSAEAKRSLRPSTGPGKIHEELRRHVCLKALGGLRTTDPATLTLQPYQHKWPGSRAKGVDGLFVAWRSSSTSKSPRLGIRSGQGQVDMESDPMGEKIWLLNTAKSHSVLH